MIHYCISRMWLFHAELTEKVMSHSPDDLMKNKGAIFHSFELDHYRPGLGGGILYAKWKEFPERVTESHDVYNAIDLDADSKALDSLYQYLTGTDQPGCKLIKFRYRVTDYSHLNILAIFELDDHTGLQQLLAIKKTITRAITRLTKEILLVFDQLQEQQKLTITPDYFGIPASLRKFLPDALEDDTYYYEEVVFVSGNCTGVIREVLQVMDVAEDAASEEYDGMKVYAIAQNPVWCVNQPLTTLDLTTYMEPQNLVAAEANIYSAMAVVYFAIIKLLNSSGKTGKPLQAREKAKAKEKVKAIKAFGANDLRQMQLKFGVILKEIIHRKDALELWQISYINRYKEADDIADKKAMAEKAESLLSILMDKKDQELSKRHTNILEAITISFTVLTFCSVYADIINFIEVSHNEAIVFNLLATKNLIVILFLLLSCSVVFYFFRKRAK